jgi:hypothetical protein
MKLPHEPHEHQSEQNRERRWSEKIKQYWQNMYRSKKCKSMSHGSYDLIRSMSWAKGENWRRTHPKSVNKNHK